MKVLVVDDEIISRRLLQNYVQKWGYEATTAENGAQAWQLLQESEHPILISDWVMPELDGLELVRRIRARPQSAGYIYTILITARAQKEDLVEAMEAGADDFISKPFDRDELRVRLRAGERFVRLEQTLTDHHQRLVEMEKRLAQQTLPAANNAAPNLQERLEHLLSALGRAAVPAQAGTSLTADCERELREILNDLRNG